VRAQRWARLVAQFCDQFAERRHVARRELHAVYLRVVQAANFDRMLVLERLDDQSAPPAVQLDVTVATCRRQADDVEQCARFVEARERSGIYARVDLVLRDLDL